jgi:hypothetical protein
MWNIIIGTGAEGAVAAPHYVASSAPDPTK